MDAKYLTQLAGHCSVSSDAEQATDEQAWLYARTKGVGGSDVGAICGVNPWSSALQIYFNKTGQFQEKADPSESSIERMHWGHMLEPIVASEFEIRNPEYHCMEAGCSLKSNAYPYLLANVDRLVLDKEDNIVGILECKTAGAQMIPEWDSGEVPLSYYYQVQHYMYVTGIHRGWICCLAGGNKFFQYDIFFDEELYTTEILPKVSYFWNECVLKLREPEIQSADNNLFNDLFPSDSLSDDIVSFDDSFEAIGKEYLELKQRQKADKKRIEELQAAIKQQLTSNIRGYSRSYEYSWSPRTRTSVDSYYLKSHYPEIYEECLITTEYRQMNVKKVLSDEDTSF